MVNNIGFILDDIGACQSAYLCIKNSNKFLKENIDTCISIFYSENILPCMNPRFARYHISDCTNFEGHLIATSIQSALICKEVSKSKKYYYINDLEWIRPHFDKNKEELNSILYDNSVIKFTRCEDYKKELKNNGVNVNDKIVKDFDISTILEIINEGR
jgi:hypothetical protein